MKFYLKLYFRTDFAIFPLTLSVLSTTVSKNSQLHCCLYVKKIISSSIPFLSFQEKLRTYADNLLTNATAMLAEAFGTDVPSVPKEMRAPCMRLVRLPALKGYEKTWVR